VAYSGGVDSVFLAYVAHEALGERMLAVVADTPSLPRRELAEALAIAETFQIPLRVIKTNEFDNRSYVANPNNRCYFCKHELFAQLFRLAQQLGFAVVAYGENASDVGDFRPGLQAAAEYNAHAPLRDAGLTKAEIRELSAKFGLPTADKPQMACLSSRVPYGQEVTLEKLEMVEKAEDVLRDLGFHDVRVRHHEQKSSLTGQLTHLARIEVGPVEMARLVANGLGAQVAKVLKQLGYSYVTLDLQGYRRGSLNETLEASPVVRRLPQLKPEQAA
jgi:uncharacterized protein